MFLSHRLDHTRRVDRLFNAADRLAAALKRLSACLRRPLEDPENPPDATMRQRLDATVRILDRRAELHLGAWSALLRDLAAPLRPERPPPTRKTDGAPSAPARAPDPPGPPSRSRPARGYSPGLCCIMPPSTISVVDVM